MKNFDLFIGIDWSGSKAIQTQSIALASCQQGTKAPDLKPEIRSRTAVANYIIRLAESGQRVLIGIDANFGYSYSVGQRHFGKNYTAFDQWRIIDDHAQQNQNFYAEGFWSHKKFKDDFWQSGTKPDWFDATRLRRATEIQCILDGYGHPESPFKLCYTKQVGKGGMAAMRMAHYLKQELGHKVAVFPFEETDKARLVLTEIYPRQFLMRAGWGTKKVKSLTDLSAVLPFFGSKPLTRQPKITDHDTDALVSAAGLRYLCGMKKTLPDHLIYPAGMTDPARRAEGWIFGVGDRKL